MVITLPCGLDYLPYVVYNWRHRGGLPLSTPGTRKGHKMGHQVAATWSNLSDEERDERIEQDACRFYACKAAVNAYELLEGTSADVIYSASRLLTLTERLADALRAVISDEQAELQASMPVA